MASGLDVKQGESDIFSAVTAEFQNIFGDQCNKRIGRMFNYH